MHNIYSPTRAYQLQREGVPCFKYQTSAPFRPRMRTETERNTLFTGEKNYKANVD